MARRLRSILNPKFRVTVNFFFFWEGYKAEALISIISMLKAEALPAKLSDTPNGSFPYKIQFDEPL